MSTDREDRSRPADDASGITSGATINDLPEQDTRRS
jgi:hypothetical protein